MYTCFSVNYDLRAKAKPDYEGLIEELKRSSYYWHFLESTWLIATNETATELWQRIKQHIHGADSLLIIEVRDNASGWLSKEAWKWIRKYVSSPGLVPIHSPRG
jgi:hypothetical protein